MVINLGRGKKINQTFSFLKYGGEAMAYQAARTFRDEMVLSHPPQQQHERLCGVYKRSGGKQIYWVAQTQGHDGKHVRKFFNVGLLGEEQALALAIEERQQQLKKIANRQYRDGRRERLYLQLSGGQGTVQINGAI